MTDISFNYKSIVNTCVMTNIIKRILLVILLTSLAFSFTIKSPIKAAPIYGNNSVDALLEKIPIEERKECPCIRNYIIFNKARAIAIENDTTIGRAYRIDSDLYLSPEMIGDALACKCAKALVDKYIIGQTKVGPGLQLSKKGSRVSQALEVYGKVGKRCKTLLKFDSNFTGNLDYKNASILLRNLAAEMGGDTVVGRYKKKKWTRGRILRCKPANVDHKLKIFSKYVYDSRTGLTWQRCSRGLKSVSNKCKGRVRRSTHSSARNYCYSLPSVRRKKWRLPEIDELATIVRRNRSKIAQTSSYYFPDTLRGVYWTDTPYSDPAAFMGVDFETGRKIAYDKTKNGYTRCAIRLSPDRFPRKYKKLKKKKRDRNRDRDKDENKNQDNDNDNENKDDDKDNVN